MNQQILSTLLSSVLLSMSLGSCSPTHCSKLDLIHTHIMPSAIHGEVLTATSIELMYNEEEMKIVKSYDKQWSSSMMTFTSFSPEAVRKREKAAKMKKIGVGQSLSIKKSGSGQLITIEQPIYCNVGPIKVGTKGRIGTYEGRRIFFPI